MGALLLCGSTDALAQTDYTGAPIPVDTYVDPYTEVGSAPLVVAQLPLPTGFGAPGAAGSVRNQGLSDPQEIVDPADRRLLTGWDLIGLAALGLTAAVAFAVSAGRFRYH